MKKILFLILSLICLQNIVFAEAPTFNSFKGNLEGETVYNKITVSSSSSLETNIKTIFYPTSGDGGLIRRTLRIVMVGVLILYFVWAGYMFVIGAGNDGEIKKARMNLIYILYGAFLFFAATWILGTGLSITNLSGTEGLVDNFQNKAMFQILSFLKGAAFFIAIIMLVYYGYRIMMAYEKEDKIKEGRTGAINVLVALVFIKIIDYVYYIAQQQTFKTKAADFIVSLSRLAGYVLGILLVLTIIYAGMQLVSSTGDQEKWKKAKSAIKTVFLVVMMVFLFLLILNQVIVEVGI